MFCANCGKEIGDAKFCQYCGNPTNSVQQKTENPAQKVQPAPSKNSTNAKSYGSFINLISLCGAMVSILIRIIHNTEEEIWDIFSSEISYIVSETGRNYMITVMVVQGILSALFYTLAKTARVKVPGKVCIWMIVSLIIQVVAMLLRVPYFE